MVSFFLWYFYHSSFLGVTLYCTHGGGCSNAIPRGGGGGAVGSDGVPVGSVAPVHRPLLLSGSGASTARCSKAAMLTASEDATAYGSHAPHRPRRHRASARTRSPPGWPNSSGGLRTLPLVSSMSNGRRQSQWWNQALQTRISIPSPPILSAPSGTRGCRGRYPEPKYPYPPSAGTAGTLPLHTFSQNETSSRSRPQGTSSSTPSPTMTRLHQPIARRLQRPLD